MYDVFDIVVEKYIDDAIDEPHYESLLLNIFEVSSPSVENYQRFSDKLNEIYEKRAKMIKDGVPEEKADKWVKREYNKAAHKYSAKRKKIENDKGSGVTIMNLAASAGVGAAAGSLIKHHKLKKEGIVQYLKDNKERYNTLKNKVKNKMTISDSDKKFMKEYEDTKSYYKKNISKSAWTGAAVGSVGRVGYSDINRAIKSKSSK